MRKRKIITIIVFILFVLIVGRNLTFLPRFSFLSNTKNQTSSLKKQIQDITAQQKGNYTVYFSDLVNQNLSFGINEHFVHIAASVNKVPIVATLYYLASKNKIDFDERVTIQKEDIQDYGTGKLRYEKAGGTYSLKTLAKLALQNSDNTAVHILAKKIGMSIIQKTIEDFGLTQTDMANNKTTLSDMYILFKKIYKREIANSSLTRELLDFLKDTDIEDRIPKLLPQTSRVYHKTGDAVGTIHDVGLVKYNDSIFFVGVMTSDIGDNEETTKNTIAKIAKMIFDFYINRL